MQVLVADDSGTMRTIIRVALKSLGIHNPVEAVDGLEAVELFKEGGIDLILSDWHMPGKTGLQVVREIRALDKKVPIIMVTTEAEREHIVEAVHSGASDYLVKPFTTADLEKKLLRFIAKV